MAARRGHVDRADSMALAGWALDAGDPTARPLLHVVQRGLVVAAARPATLRPTLRRELGLPESPHPPVHGWAVPLPLVAGLRPDVAFSVVFAEDGTPLEGGDGLVIRSLARMDAEAAADLAALPLVQIAASVQADQVQILARALQADPPHPLTLTVGGGPPREVERIEAPPAPGFARPVLGFRARVSRARLEKAARHALPVRLRFPGDEADTRLGFHHRLRALHLPRDLFAEAPRPLPMPGMGEMRRVMGPAASAPDYLISGLTSFIQLDAMTLRFAGRRLTRIPCVVDWGVGCARVLRHFAESAGPLGLPAPSGQRLLGLDIDPVNIGWCQAQLGGLAEFALLRPDGFDLPAESVDLLYGISVMTHLTELDQGAWLAEIRRVLKPGGLAILTVHGEMALYAEPAGLALPFVERFGFFDGIADAALGAGQVLRYRSTYHARRYIRAVWSRWFEILDVIPAANAFRQDFVVLKRPG